MQTELFEQEEDRSEIWSVTEITQAIHKSLQNQFPVLWVRGEISNLRVQASGHRYFLLKDENCQLKAVFFRGDAVGSAYLPKEGDDCIAYGEISVYEPRGEYQLRVRHVLQDGLGNLRLQFDRLKEKLLQEGLFEEHRKRSLPNFARTIGVVTSPDGAALQDFLSILKRRGWTGQIWIITSLVQGKEAPTQLLKGIEQASEIIQEWMLTRYNFEAKSFIRKPANLVVLRRKTGAMKRRVLISVDDDTPTKSTEGPCADWEVFGTEEVFDATHLLLELEEIVEKYDVQSVYSSLQHHVSHLEKLQCNEDEDEEERFTINTGNFRSS